MTEEAAGRIWVLDRGMISKETIRQLQADEHQRGCLMEERVLHGDLAYESSMPRLAGDEERFVLLAMHQTLVERGSPARQGERE